MGLSVIIITKNEANHIADCLQSVAWANEVIVVDSGSKDDTIAICQRYTNNVFIHNDWQGFGQQKNRALSYASQDWVLSLDADERVTPALRQAIEQAMNSDATAFAMPRQAYFLGHAMRHGGWWPDYVTRLFRRDKARFSDDIVHEHVIATGQVVRLTEPLLHYSYDNVHQLLDKINRYSSDGAIKAHAQGKRSSLLKALAKALWTFFRAYILRLGLLDGSAGFIAALSKAEETYYRYLKLHYLGQ